jgi:protein required for attachment to host cells
MDIYWVVVADASRARIFQCYENGRAFSEIEAFDHPEGRAKARELGADAQGRYFGKGERNEAHTAEPRTDPVDRENESFAKHLAAHLERGLTEKKYQRLNIVAAPKFLGLLRGSLDKQVERAVAETHPKDLSALDARTIHAHLFPQNPVS